MTDRKELLNCLIGCPKESERLAKELAAFGWDSDVELVTLRAADVAAVLDQYLAGGLRSEEVEAWANALEMRNDVAVEGGTEGAVYDAAFELANPALEGPLSHERARELRRGLAG